MQSGKVFKSIALCLLFIILGFGGGYFTSMSMLSINKVTPENSKKEENIEIYKPQPTVEETFIAEPPQKYYLLKNENSYLTLYEIYEDEKHIIRQTGIDIFFLPSEDREKLKNGIKLTSIEEGFELIEDFTS